MPGNEYFAQKDGQEVRNSLRRFFRMIVPYNPPRPQITEFPFESIHDWSTPQDIADLEDYIAELDAEKAAQFASDTSVVDSSRTNVGTEAVSQAMLDLMSQPKF